MEDLYRHKLLFRADDNSIICFNSFVQETTFSYTLRLKKAVSQFELLIARQISLV